MDVVITDLDGTLLDQHSYSFELARPALAELQRRKTPVVICTSKTRAEAELWREALGNRDPFIVENGGAVYIPLDHFPFLIPAATCRAGYNVLQLGSPYVELVDALREASQESHCQVSGFANMTPSEVADKCNISTDEACLAKQREYDEPFSIEDESRTPDLLSAIEKRGKRWTRGGRFHHITGANDKAKAVRLLLGIYRQVDAGVRSIGLGDGPNDASFLNEVDVPILIKSPLIRELRSAVPRGRVTLSSGPEGWNQAILELLSKCT